jgi:pimeloyl-ACP methyl ester carboxylesterase
VPIFTAPDQTVLAYRSIGTGDPLICLPGGPMQDSVYLGDLGGLAARRTLVPLDLRGTGDSAVPADPASYRCDRQIDDVEALRQHLGLERIDLLGHSAGANLALLYAAAFPQRVGSLTLITPSGGAVGITITGPTRRAIAELRRGEPWFEPAFAALERVTANQGGDDDWAAIAPFFYGRWDAAAQAHHAAESEQAHPDAARIFGSSGAFTPAETKAALAELSCPVLLVAGEFDLNSPPSAVSELAACFADATLVVQPGAGHQPWLDDAAQFVLTLTSFLGTAAAQ